MRDISTLCPVMHNQLVAAQSSSPTPVDWQPAQVHLLGLLAVMLIMVLRCLFVCHV